MILKETDAKKRYCPLHEGEFCSGGRCMAWEFAIWNGQTITEFGYCGFTGGKTMSDGTKRELQLYSPPQR